MFPNQNQNISTILYYDSFLKTNQLDIEMKKRGTTFLYLDKSQILKASYINFTRVSRLIYQQSQLYETLKKSDKSI